MVKSFHLTRGSYRGPSEYKPFTLPWNQSTKSIWGKVFKKICNIFLRCLPRSLKKLVSKERKNGLKITFGRKLVEISPTRIIGSWDHIHKISKQFFCWAKNLNGLCLMFYVIKRYFYCMRWHNRNITVKILYSTFIYL